MAERVANLGERISSLEATVAALEKYERDRWHRLANDLQPLIVLPERLTRDIARMQGSFDGKISTVSKEIERSITAAIEKALAPVNDDITLLKSKVEVLEGASQRQAGVAGLLRHPVVGGFVGALVAAAVAAWAWISGK